MSNEHLRIPMEKIRELGGYDRFQDSSLVSECALCRRALHRDKVGGPWLDDSTATVGGTDGLEGYCSGTKAHPGPVHIAVSDLPDKRDPDAVERWLDS